jgi:hypothetical protein
MDESQLILALNEHDALVAQCVRGELELEAFLQRYDNFPMRWALDGHESDGNGGATLQRHADRIHVHQRVWEEVLCHLTSDDLANAPASRAAGFFGPAEAVQRLREIAIATALLDRTE